MANVHIVHLSILLLLMKCVSMSVNQICPSQCNCTVHMDMITANCSGQRLIEAIGDIPSSIELLDLSQNDIISISNECFSTLSYLRILLLERNSISFIELEAFSSLHLLESINLANNRLEWFDNRLFEQNHRLTHINLSGNKFMELSNEPILRSESIKTLDLHKSQLTHLHVKYFENLPNLRTIDLSENLLIVLNLAAFATNTMLQHIDIRKNHIGCDEQFKMLVVWLKRNQINVLNDNCPQTETMTIVPHKLERLQTLTTLSASDKKRSPQIHNETTTNRSISDKKHVSYNRIPILNKKCADNESHSHACHLFESCTSSFSILLDEIEYKLMSNSNEFKSHCTTSQSIDDIVSVRMAFYVGFAISSIICPIIFYVLQQLCGCMCHKLSKRTQTESNQGHHQIRVSEMCTPIDDNMADNYTYNEAVSRITNHDCTYGAVVPARNRHSQQAARSFFAIFTERPIQRRYYQNATNLVRRISQSRLFLNSSRINRNEISRAREAAINTPTVQNSEENTLLGNERNEIDLLMNNDTDELNDIETEQRSLNISNSIVSLNMYMGSGSRHNGNNARVFASAIDLTTSRETCETLPPPYTDSVHS